MRDLKSLLIARSLSHRPGGYGSARLATPERIGHTTTKTGSQLQQDVMAELKWEPAVHAEQIGVEVKNGVVTLAGEVSTYTEKLDAERAAQRVNGVKALAVEMKVKLSQLGKRTDADIAESAKNILGWTSSLPAAADAKAIAVEVKGADVTLTGTVHSWAERDLATRSAWGSAGVRKVVDKMNLVY